MKKVFYSTIAAVASLLLVTACSKEVKPSVPEGHSSNPEGDTTPVEKITISVNIPDGMTKVAFADDPENPDGAMSLQWSLGDQLVIADAADPENNNTTFTLVKAEGTNSGIFSGELLEAESYNITLVDKSSAIAQLRDADPSHLKYCATLSGVTTALNSETAITFSSSWAEEHGGTFSESAVLRIRAKLPEGVTGSITSVHLAAYDSNDEELLIFDGGTSSTLTITLGEPADEGSDNVLTLYASLPASEEGISIAEGAYLMVTFNSENDKHTVYTHKHVFPAGNLRPGMVNSLKLPCTKIDKFAGRFDDGTADHPYLIADKYQLAAVSGLLASETKYFKLIADIDMEGASWTPINPEKSPWNPINLDGNGKTISNLGNSLFYVFKGSAKDLTLKNCDATDGTQRGIFAQYIQGDGEHTVSNVDVLGGTVQAGNGNMGGLVGRINNPSGGTTTAIITDCDVKNTTITGKSTGTGGLIGLVESVITVTNTSITGTSVTGNDGAVALGGIVGKVTSASSFSNCTFEKGDGSPVSVTGPSKTGAACSGDYAPGNIYVGGIAGEVSGAASFNDCHVKNATLTVTNPTDNTSYWKNVGGAFGYIHNAGAKVGNTTACTVENISVPAHHFAAGFVSAVDGGTIENSTVSGLTISGQNFVGGFVSIINSGTISKCSVAGNPITNANATVSGFAAYIYGSAILKGNSTSLQIGKADRLTATNNGGFAGQVIAAASIENCSASGDVYASGNYVGGFAGYVTNGTFTSCNASGAVSSGGNRVGGLLGAVTLATVSKCSATGDVNGNQYVGGIIGQALPANNTTISVSESYYSKGTVSATNYAGGIVGITYQGGDTGSLTITNCYMAGGVSVSGKWAGGILGSHYKGIATLENCYDTGFVTGPIGVGGIVGYVNANGLSVTRCFPFNSSISATNKDGEQHESSGAVVAYGKNKTMVVDWCYRVSDMASKFNDCTGNAANVIEQHGFIKTMAVIPQRKNLTNGYYHHGRNTNNSLSNLVHSGAIGENWSEEIWDWSGSRPVLKNNRETLE